jgi:hypothetical protein
VIHHDDDDDDGLLTVGPQASCFQDKLDQLNMIFDVIDDDDCDGGGDDHDDDDDDDFLVSHALLRSTGELLPGQAGPAEHDLRRDRHAVG